MNLLTNEQRRFFLDNGYLVVKRTAPHESLVEARRAAMRVVQKCVRGDYPYCRADNRLSDHFIEKIEHIFHPDIYEPSIFKAVVESRILDYAKEAMGHQDVFVSFFRMHPTVGYSAWSSWHRDDMPDGKHDNTIKATLPLYPECGFHLVPGSHKQGDSLLEGQTESEFKGHFAQEIRVPVDAGDILLFHTAIVHRASCAGRNKYRRAQIHFRITATKHVTEGPRVDENWSTRPEVLAIADNSWRDALTKEVDRSQTYPITERGKSATTVRAKAKQMLARAFYYGSALLPASHPWMANPPKGYVPYVRVPKEFWAMFH
jgi:ectoine hydroxylase-related dioxygenase (phytanoyl-CoA dioxygenase family)